MRRIKEAGMCRTIAGFFGAAVLACLIGCGGNGPGPAAPTAVAPAPSLAPAPGPSVPFTVTVTDGWTGTPVVGAQISAQGTDALTDIAGKVQVTPRTWGCLPVSIVAVGFLQRRTCATSSITLWPVADEIETAATRSAAFYYYDRMFSAYRMELALAPDIGQRPEVVAVWKAAADVIRAQTSGKLSIPTVQTVSSGEGYIVSFASSPPTCGHPWFRWSFQVAGFCWDTTADYFVSRITVAPGLIDRPDVALRALLYGYALHPHVLPGLMNINQPGTELSAFERKTLHMMSLRWPTLVDWPDLDHVL